jgi:hypothetical protein
MGTDYGHPWRLAYHTALSLTAIAIGIWLLAWCWSRGIPAIQENPVAGRYHWSNFVLIFGMIALVIAVWMIW